MWGPRQFSAVGAFATAVAVGFMALIGASQSAHADLLQKVKDRGELVAGTEARFPPFEFVEDGEIVGYSADMMDIIMEDLPGVELDRLDLPWQGILPGLKQEKFDVVITSVTVTSKRCKAYDLTYPIADASFAVLKKAGDESIQKPEDIVGKVIGSQAGSAQLQGLERLADKLEEETGETIAGKETYTDFNEAYSDLAAGRLDGVVQSLPNLLHVAKQRPEVFEVVRPTFGQKTYFTWATRDEAESKSLHKFLNEQIAELNKSGKMEELQKKWFGGTMDVPARDVCADFM